MNTQTDGMTLETKKEILNRFIRLQEEELNRLHKGQREQLDSANQEDIDKGDLVESPREQMMDEVDLQTAAIDQLQADIQALRRIDLSTAHHTVSVGSLIRTNVKCFLVSKALPEIQFEGKKIIGISPESPLYQKMKGLKAHAEFHLGNIEYVISEII